MAEILYHADDPTISAEVIRCDGYAILRYNDGTEIKMPGWGAMKGKQLDLDPRIDLTKPIYEQAMRLWKEDEERERTRHGGKAA